MHLLLKLQLTVPLDRLFNICCFFELDSVLDVLAIFFRIHCY